jgi:uncharacterized OB-fold protein
MRAMGAEQVPIAPGLFTWPAEEPQLIGGKCNSCGVVTFPRQSGCPRCNSQDITDELLARRGTLWTWTIQGFLPKSPPYAGPETPETFQPYGVGYVELPGQVKVEARLTENDPEKLRIGMEMELVIIPFRTDEEGREVVTYAFAPVNGS